MITSQKLMDPEFPHGPDNKVPNTFALGYLINTRCKETYIEGYTKNLLEFYSFKYKKFNQISELTEEALFEKALSRGYNKLLVIKQGNILQDFIETFRDEYYEKWSNVTLAGHILDRGDQYWQLHPQLFYIDLDWWVVAGKPSFGVRDVDNSELYKAVAPIRSTETLVEGEWYNPISVTSGIETKTYLGRWEGNELLQKLFSDPNTVIKPWPQYMRKQKEYLYPEMPDFYEQNHCISELFQETSGWYVANNEPINKIDQVKNLKVLVTHCAGMSPWISAYINGLKPGGTIMMIDICGVGLAMQHQAFMEWDGVDWNSHIQKVIDSNPVMNWKMFRGQKHLERQSNQAKSIEGFTEWWQSDNRRHLNVEHHKMDYLSYRKILRMIKTKISSIDEQEMLMIDLSNAFNYEYTSLIADLSSRIKIEKEYIKFLDSKNVYCKTIDLEKTYKTTSMYKLFPWSKE